MTADWLKRYGNRQHEWREIGTTQNRVAFGRQIGLVETAFDVDGVHYGGRADLCHFLDLEIKTGLIRDQLHDRVVLAWAVLRLHHPLLLSKVTDRQFVGELQRCFVVSVPTDPTVALEEARECVTSLLDHASIDMHEFRLHALNTGRIVDPDKALSKLFILPLENASYGRFRLRLVMVLAHMIADGLSMFHWVGHFIALLNTGEEELIQNLSGALPKKALLPRLPPAQEDLYPPVAANKARERWFWAIVRVLRHVRKPLPSAFINPLRRRERHYLKLDRKYPKIFDYSETKLPPLNTAHSAPEMSADASRRLATLCKQAGTSVGAGIFALVALAMMEIEEHLHPHIPLPFRKPFIASFPLNPRLFFNYKGPFDSCMLAFSDGIVMPWLPTHLNLDGRLRLLAKIAHRQLKTYQKRKSAGMDAHSPLRMVAGNYLTAVERTEDKSPPQYRKGINPQGAYPANFVWQAATCGVSSVGSVAHWVSPGRYDFEAKNGGDLVADFRGLVGGVRARDNEFLCGNSSDEMGRLKFAVSYDLSAMDPVLVRRWEQRIETILEPSGDARL